MSSYYMNFNLWIFNFLQFSKIFQHLQRKIQKLLEIAENFRKSFKILKSSNFFQKLLQNYILLCICFGQKR